MFDVPLSISINSMFPNETSVGRVVISNSIPAPCTPGGKVLFEVLTADSPDGTITFQTISWVSAVSNSARRVVEFDLVSAVKKTLVPEDGATSASNLFNSCQLIGPIESGVTRTLTSSLTPSFFYREIAATC